MTKSKKSIRARRKRRKLRSRDLIVLRFDSGGKGVETVGVAEAQRGDKDFSINLAKRKWTDSEVSIDVCIGRWSHFRPGQPHAIIGVYNHRNRIHMTRMVEDAVKAGQVKEPCTVC